jgi:hypothetical protein
VAPLAVGLRPGADLAMQNSTALSVNLSTG